MGRYCNCHSDRLSLAFDKTTLKTPCLVSTFRFIKIPVHTKIVYIIMVVSSGLLSGRFLCHTMRLIAGSLLARFPASTVRLGEVLADCSGLIGL